MGCFDGLMTIAAIKNSMKSTAYNENPCLSGFAFGLTSSIASVDYLDRNENWALVGASNAP
jgi:hypothetical protein